MASYSFPGAAHKPGLQIGGRSVSSAQTAWVGYVLALATYAVAFGEWQKQPVPDYVHALGVLIAALCFFPMALWVARGSRAIPAFELICIAYLMAFSVPVYMVRSQIMINSEPIRFTWEEVASALSLAATGIAGLLLGYYVAFASKFPVESFQIDLPMHPAKRLTFVKFALIVGFIPLIGASMGMNTDAGALNSFVNLLRNLTNVAIVLLGYRVIGGQESKNWTIVLYAASGAAALFGLATGMLESAVVPLLMLVIIRWNVSRRLPMPLLVVGMCVFILLNSVKVSYRAQTWNANKHVGVSERISIWANLLMSGDSTAHSNGSNFGDSSETAISRFDALHKFTWVMMNTPSKVPYYNGSTYAYLIYGWIPRFMWPDKPSASTDAAYRIDTDYQLVPQGSVHTSNIGIGGFLPEAFANFGAPGVFIILFIQGAVFAFLDRLLNGPYSEGGRAIYLAVMVFFLNGIGSSTVTLFGALLQTILANALIMRFFATTWRVKTKHRSLAPLAVSRSYDATR